MLTKRFDTIRDDQSVDEIWSHEDPKLKVWQMHRRKYKFRLTRRFGIVRYDQIVDEIWSHERRAYETETKSVSNASSKEDVQIEEKVRNNSRSHNVDEICSHDDPMLKVCHMHRQK